MSVTAYFTEIRKLKNEELKEIQKMDFTQLVRAYERYLSLFPEEYETKLYKSVRKYCTKVKTVDNKTIYVCKSRMHLCTTNKLIISSMQSFVDREESEKRYINITKYSGKKVGSSECVYDPYTDSDIEREAYYILPNVEEGGRLLYHVC